MIDWVTLTAPYRGDSINGGHMVSVLPSGEIEYSVDKRLTVEGSFSDKAFVRAYGDEIQISVNPSKFLQGHNLFGTNDLSSLVFLTVTQILSRLKECSDQDHTLEAVRLGQYKITRIDLTESFSLGSRSDCLNWLAAARLHLVEGRQKTNRQYTETIYVGQNSNRMTVKIYYKGDEFRKHPSNHSIDIVDSLKHWANDKIRIEVTLRGKQLKEHVFCNGFVKVNKRAINCKKMTMEKPMFWTEETFNKVYWHVVNLKVRLPKDSSIARFDMNNLRRAVRSTYFMWVNGMNPKEHLPRNTFYRHRAELLEQIGVDIKTLPHQVSTRNVIPLVRVLEAKPASIPQWAYEFGLVVNS